jgi:hypothetical protein
MGKLRLILAILVFGSLWGFLEATLGGFLHFIHLPQKGMIMTAVAVALMSATRASYRRPGMQIGMGLIAALLKGSNALFLGADVIRPMMAILVEAMVFDSAVTFLSKMDTKDHMRALAGALTGYASYLWAAFFGYFIIRAKSWLGMASGEMINFLFLEGTVVAVICWVSALLGFKLTSRVRLPTYNIRAYSSLSVALVSVFWLVGVFG